MHAIRQHEFGPPSTLRYELAPDPRPGDGQVRIAVEAAGVHVLDTTIRRGAQGGPFPLPHLPMTPGREVAGVVDEIGPGIDGSWLGRRVVAHLGQASGGYAELALAPAERLHAIPADLPADAAVAMIGTGRTALGILDAADLQATDIVLVTAAAGGLGSLFVQEAVAVGATAVALAGGTRKVELARSLGAAIAVDYREPGWADTVRKDLNGRPATVQIDPWGGSHGDTAATLLGPGGRLVRFGAADGAPPGVRTIVVTGAQIMQRPGGMRELEAAALARAISGAWRPLTQTFPLAQAAAAHEAIESRATTGKVVLVP